MYDQNDTDTTVNAHHTQPHVVDRYHVHLAHHDHEVTHHDDWHGCNNAQTYAMIVV